MFEAPGRSNVQIWRAQTCTFEGPGLKKTPKFNEKTPRERRKSEISDGRRKKKGEMLRGPAEGRSGGGAVLGRGVPRQGPNMLTRKKETSTRTKQNTQQKHNKTQQNTTKHCKTHSKTHSKTPINTQQHPAKSGSHPRKSRPHPTHTDTHTQHTHRNQPQTQRHNLAKLGLAKLGLAKVGFGQSRFGQSRP